MPEGDSVYRVCGQLDRALAGGQLTRAEIRIPSLAASDLVGWSVEAVVPRGKHLLIRLTAPGREGLTLHNHLMMEGRWQIDTAPPGTELGGWRSPGHQARIVLESAHADGSRARAIAFEVQQVRLVRTAEEERELVGHLGPDLLDPAWGSELSDAAVARLLDQPERALGVAMLDQTRLAGIGNVYRSELCFLARVHPTIPVGAFASDHDLPGFVDLAHRLLLVNRDRTGRVTTGGMLGRRANLWVYGRAGQRCRRCGAIIERSYIPDPSARAYEDRSIYVCPRCQPGCCQPS